MEDVVSPEFGGNAARLGTEVTTSRFLHGFTTPASSIPVSSPEHSQRQSVGPLLPLLSAGTPAQPEPRGPSNALDPASLVQIACGVLGGTDTPPLLGNDSCSTTPATGPMRKEWEEGMETPPQHTIFQTVEEQAEKERQAQLLRARKEQLRRELMLLDEQESRLGVQGTEDIHMEPPDLGLGSGFENESEEPVGRQLFGDPLQSKSGFSVAPGQLISPEMAMQLAASGWGVSSMPTYTSAQASPQRGETDATSPLMSTGVDSSRGHFAVMARDGQGSRWLIRQLHEGNEVDVQAVFDELVEHMDLAADAQGSQVLMALFKCATDLQRSFLCERLANDLSLYAYNMHGTRLLQKVIELARERDQVAPLMMAVACQAHTLMKDLNGNHIVQQCLQSLPPDLCQPLHDMVLPRVIEFGTHRHGCCVLQRCIEYGSQDQQMQLVVAVIENALQLVQDPFGNYLLQYILEMDVDFINIRVMRQFFGSIAPLSTNKFASNVIEKCLKLAPDDVRDVLVREIVEPTRLAALLQDQYANYVVQTALAYSNAQQFQLMSREIGPLMNLIRNTPHGKRIETRLRQGIDARRAAGQAGSDRGRAGSTGMPERSGSGSGPGSRAHTPSQQQQQADAWGRTPPWAPNAESAGWLEGQPSPQRSAGKRVLASGGTMLSEPPIVREVSQRVPQEVQNSPPRPAGGFRLNANAVPFQALNSPSGGSAVGSSRRLNLQGPTSSPESLSPPRTAGTTPTPQVATLASVHPALIFGAD
eukprot:Hpha_TRINITY_DN26319_c0_g1::TRINITY_DN26319_c0_g1_i1::g.9319::m.9319